jgi:hypothetical protein
MADPSKKSLTSPYTVDMKVSKDEKRILENLRAYAVLLPFSEFAATLHIHEKRVKSGTVEFGKTKVKL